MRRRLLSLGLLSLLGCLCALGAVPSSFAASGPQWGTASGVPGMSGLNGGGHAVVNSVSCPAVGFCAAGGSYTDGTGVPQAFVTDETNGSWGNATEVPGSGSLNSGGAASVTAVSCPTAGNCAAGGNYTGGSGGEAFVADETGGSWGNAVEIPGTASLNSGGNAVVNSISCASAGNCVVGGTYTDSLGNSQAFVADETNGTWGTAVEVPGTGQLNTGGAAVNGVSCASAGNCAAVGHYTNTSSFQTFVANETNGTWGTAIETPGSVALNSGGVADLVSVSCASAGNCTAGGYYRDASNHNQAFVVDEVSGSWGNAAELPGIGGLNTAGAAAVSSVSCASAGNCAAAGYYRNGSGYQAFVVNETNGTWNTANEVMGTASLNAGGGASVQSVSCASPGNCSAGGYYSDAANHNQAFVVDETNGVWGTAIEVPGTAALDNGGTAEVSSVSCATAGNCAAGGSYFDSHATDAFLANSISGSKTDQVIQVTKHAPSTAVFGTGFTVTATGGGSGLPVTFGSSGGCTHTGATFTMTSGSTSCTVTYDQAGNANYNPATQVTEVVTAQKAAQTVTVTTHAPATATYGTSFGVGASAPGGGITISTTGTCTNAATSVTMTSGTGTCTVHYNQPGNANYNAASEVIEQVTALKATQSITFSAPANHTYGDSDVTPGATASSGLAVSYGVSGTCSLAGGLVHLTGAGSCTVTASQDGDANYSAAQQVQHGFTIGKAALTVTASAQQKTVGQVASLGTTAFTSSGLVGSDSVSSVTLTSTGTDATAPIGNYPIVPSAAVAGSTTDLGNYTISYVNGTLHVTPTGQTITFAQPSDRTWGDADFDPGATASSGLAVSYGATGSCTIAGGIVHLTGAGSCTVTASQAGNADYAAAPDVQQSFSIARLAVTVTAANQQKLRRQTLSLGTAAFTTSPLVGSDSITSVTLTSAGTPAAAAAGSYPIVPSAAVAGGSTNLQNYAITYVNGTLAVLNAGLVGLNGVTVSTSGGLIDSFDSSHGAYKNANRGSSALVLSNGAVSLAGVSLAGDVMGSTVSVASSAHVTGLVTQAAPSPLLTAAPVTRCAALSKTAGKGGKFSYSPKTGNLKVVSGTVTLKNGTYCFNNVVLSPKSTLAVSGPVTIHLRGKLSGKGALFNKTSRPGSLRIDTSFKGGNALALVGGSHAYMTVYAPATTVSIAGGSFFGTVLAGTVKLTGKTAFHADLH